MFPTFIVIGAPKAGTTSLYEYLRAHPQVFMAETKELDFFIAERNWDRGVDWYRRQFRSAGDSLAVGEASVGYSRDPWHAGVPERMQRIVPGVLLVYVLREPLARMRSQYLHELLERWEHRDIDTALLEEPKYLDASRYAHQMETFLAQFPRDQLFVTTTEELRSHRGDVLRDVFEFIGVDPDWSSADLETEHNPIGERRRGRWFVPTDIRESGLYRAVRRLVPLGARRAVWRLLSSSVDVEGVGVQPDTRAELLRRLRPDLRRLRYHLGDEFHCWGHLE